MHDALAEWMADHVHPSFATSEVVRIGTGHSRAMYRVRAHDGRRAVVRAEQGGVFGTTGAEECRVMAALSGAGFPVAQIVAIEPTGATIGHPFFVMEFLEGAEGGEGADDHSVDGETAGEFVSTLARLHRVDGRAFGFDIVPERPQDATALQVRRWLDVFRSAVSRPDPLVEEAAAWLIREAPPLERLSVVHGDAGPGNFVHRDGRVVAVTDWEFAHLGDPAEDFAFCVSMRGSRSMRREEWLQLFEEKAGFTMEPALWRYWEAFNLFKGACANRTCLALFESGVNRRPNMAIIGASLHQVFLRRLCELVGPRGKPTG
jgi:aminoglycoside phosphotransferase (APT) family kinase protein